MYKEKFNKLIIKGIIGIVLGFVLALVLYSGAGDIAFPIAIVISLLFTGVPYGWQLSGKIFGFIRAGNFYTAICVFTLRMFISLYLGGIAYPIMLIYTTIRMIIEIRAEKAALSKE